MQHLTSWFHKLVRVSRSLYYYFRETSSSSTLYILNNNPIMIVGRRSPQVSIVVKDNSPDRVVQVAGKPSANPQKQEPAAVTSVCVF